MAWITLILAGCFEVAGVTGINMIHKHKDVKSFLFMVLGFSLSFLFLSLAMNTIPMGTAYAVWTGCGTVGSTLVGMFIYGESKDWKRILFISMVLVAAVGLKLIS